MNPIQNSVLLPQPPFGALVDPAVEFWVTTANIIAGFLGTAYAVYDWRRSGKPTFLLLLLGGAAMTSIEPFIDTVGGCWFPPTAWTAFKTYGRPIPVWLIFSYISYFGIGMGVMWRLMRKGLSRGQLWALYLGGIAADCLLEMVLLQFKPYMYYGRQPLMVLGFPLWWAAINALTPMAAAVLVFRYENYLTRSWRQLLILPMSIAVTMAVNAMVGWPSWMAINTPVPQPITQLGGVASFLFSAWFMSLVVQTVSAEPAKAAAGPWLAFTLPKGR
jgi:hypothetical protein